MKVVTKLFKSLKSRLFSLLYAEKFCKGRALREKFSSIEKLAANHFEFNPEHPCRPTLTAALVAVNLKPVTIIETGSSAWGANSTMLFDSYVNSFGGSVNSVDIRATPMIKLTNKCSNLTTMHCNDSLKF